MSEVRRERCLEGCFKGHKKVNLGFVAVQQFFFVQVGHFLLLSVGR